MNMKWLSVLVLTGVLVFANVILRKKYPQAWEKFRLLYNICMGVLSLILMALLFMGAYQVVSSDMDAGGKVLFVLFVIAYIAVIIWANYSCWCGWLRKRRVDK